MIPHVVFSMDLVVSISGFFFLTKNKGYFGTLETERLHSKHQGSRVVRSRSGHKLRLFLFEAIEATPGWKASCFFWSLDVINVSFQKEIGDFGVDSLISPHSRLQVRIVDFSTACGQPGLGHPSGKKLTANRQRSNESTGIC